MKGKIVKTDDEWRKILTPEQFEVTRRGGTECAFTGKFWDFKGKGIFRCVCCGNPLFKTGSKFDSGTGWPSFWQPSSKDAVVEREDRCHGMVRTEILCSRCDAHLGHMFKDGPKPTGLRFCINSAALKFEEEKQSAAQDEKPRTENATFAAGCFWGVEETFRLQKGVVNTTVGYTGGKTVNPTYKEVCTDKTGHAEAVLVEFDPNLTSYEKLLDVFWSIHDPTTLNRQGPDVGTQYRSAIFYHDEGQKAAAEKSKKKLEDSGVLPRPVVTEIVPAEKFWPAEEYHQRYIQKKGGPSCH